MKRYNISKDDIRSDVMNWAIEAKELAAYTCETMKEELKEVDFSELETEDENGMTWEELIQSYTDVAHTIAEELKKNKEGKNMKYQIYLVTDSYREELESVELEATTEDDAAQEWLDGYKANNAGQPDNILEEIEVGAAWIEAERI